MCASGRENLCENLQFFGCGYPQGGMADYFTVAASRLHAVPDTLDDHTAALIEPEQMTDPANQTSFPRGCAAASSCVFGRMPAKL
ncbi:MAG: hypothetical protein ACLPN6_29305 [Streptosporangiaceae bacterium]